MTNKLEAERAELDAVLASGILGKTNNLVRLLTYVCEKYFDGETDEIKEYSIAVQALGRPQNFDPQLDTIVRVTAHTLRKRLEEYYRTEGAEHPVHICLPAGRYVPTFVRRKDLSHKENGHGLSRVVASTSTATPTEVHPGPSITSHEIKVVEAVPPGVEPVARRPQRGWTIVGAVAAIVCLFLLGWYLRNYKANHAASPQPQIAIPATTAGTIRALIGGNRNPYSDESGDGWEPDRFCTGGESFSVSKTSILGTDDSQLFTAGRRGLFHCKFPVPPGIYEVHLLFAETAGLLENARNVGFTLNGGPPNFTDVVDDAGAGDTATTKVFTDIGPQNDGAIHLDFTTGDSFLNAVEIVPGIPNRALPVRIVAGRRSAYHDIAGNIWLSDRYYFGGRASKIGNDVSKLPGGGLYEGQRIGHFHYAIPVVSGKQYTLKLYFLERWFGIQNQNVGGVGSRIFDVWCNGSVLLKDFDIMSQADGKPLVKTFPHIKPTAQGKIEIYFTPSVNYPAVSAIEVLPE